MFQQDDVKVVFPNSISCYIEYQENKISEAIRYL
jgi:hypothetical protein